MKNKMSRVISVLLVLVMVLGLVPSTAFAAGVDYAHNQSASTDEYYNIISKTDWDNAPGISESEIVLNNDAGDDRQVIHIMKADATNDYVSVIPTYSEMNTSKYQTGTMLDQANWIDQNMDGEVIGVMNCCLSWYTGYPGERVGEPLGFMMLNGEIMFDPGNCGYTYGNVGFPTCVVINKDVDENGNPRPADIPKVEMPQIRSSADLDGWEDTVIPVSSGYIVKSGANQYKAAHKTDPAPRSVVGITADGQVVMMLNDGRQSPFSAGMNMYECAEVMIAAGCVFAANCDGGGSSTFVSQRPGDELKVTNSPSDGGLRPSTSGICFISTAPADGQFYKAHISAENTYFTPNSSVEFQVVGTDMSGNEAEVPADVEWQLDDASFGTIEDGVFTSNGKEGDVTVQMVYGGEVVGETSITIVLPEIAFRNETIVIGYGDTMMLPVDVTTNEGRNAVTYDGDDIVYTLSNPGLGTLVGDQFTACDASAGLTEGTITAVVCGQDAKKVTANIRFGKASEIIYDFEDGQLPLDTSKTGNIGGDDAEDTGEYIYGWHINDTRANGYFSYRYYAKKAYTPVGMDIPAQVYLVDRDNGMVRNGSYAMGIDIDWTNVTASCHGQMDIHLPESLDLTDATSVGFWMYIPAELVMDSMKVGAGFTKTDGSTTRVDHVLNELLSSSDGIDNGGWYYFSWEVLDNYKSFDYIQINSHYTAGEGSYNYYQDVTYYIDDITVDYSDATIDRENPYFTSMTIADEYTNGVEVAGQTIIANTITLMAQAYENANKTNATGLDRNSVKLYVDGVLSKADISMANNGTITVSDLYLNDGVHTLVMEVKDGQGNVGNIVRKLTVNTDKSDVRLEVPAADGLLPTGSIYWLNLVADNLSSISSVTTTVNLDYVNVWELEGMEVAGGFTAAYYINNHNDAVITFTRNGEDVAVTNVLAKLPVRIWMAKGWMDDSGIRKDYISDDPKMQDKYYILTPHAMWYSDGTRDYRLAVSAEAGVVTYTDGTTKTFSANETVIQTEMNRYYTNADRQNKWSFHICTPGEAQSKAATCTEAGYTNRVFCVGCACGSVANLGTECDTHNGCGSVLEWGTSTPATGHTYKKVDGKLVCDCGDVFSTDGFVEIDGKTMYFVGGSYVTGLNRIEGEYYNFYKDGTAYDGIVNICGTDCLFDKGKSVETDEVLLAGICGEDAVYVIHADGRMVVGGSGAMYDFKSVGSVPWYQSHRYDVKSLFVGKDITVIGNLSFYNLWYMESVTFEEGSKLQEIRLLGIAMNNVMKELILPESLKRIGDASFRELNKLETMYVPAGVNYIVSNSFHLTKNVTLQVATDSYAEDYAKKYNLKYEAYDVPETTLDSGSCGENATWEITTKGTLTISGSGAMADYETRNAPWQAYKANVKKVVIGKDITYVGKFSFMQCGKLAEIVFEEGSTLETIGHGTFGYCSALAEVTIPATVTALNDYAFYYCSGLKNVAFEDDSELTAIGMYAFWNDPALESVYIPDKVTAIGENGFLGCMDKATFYVAEGTYAHDYFKKCKVVTREPMEFTIVEGTCGSNVNWALGSTGVMTISGSGAMADYETRNAPWQNYKDMIKKVVIGKDITYVGKFNFMQCRNLAAIEFEAGIKLDAIGLGAFGYCSVLTEVTIPATVTALNDYAFYYCSGLKTVAFEDDSELTTIGMYAFWNDPALESVYVPDKVTSIGENGFLGCMDKATFYVAEGTYAHDYFKKCKVVTRNPLEFNIAEGTCGSDAKWALSSTGVMTISGSGAMADYETRTAPWQDYKNMIKKVVIGKDITYIGKFNFMQCRNLTEIEFAAGSMLETIGHGAFGYCSALTEVTVPSSVTALDNFAFYYCSSLKTVAFEDGSKLTTIGMYAFWNASALETCGYPATVELGENAFLGTQIK